MKKRKYLYLPIETKSREFEAKMLLALEAVNRGYAVIIGNKSMNNLLKIMPTGVYFYMNSTSPMQKIFAKFKSQGHIIVVHDEEGLVQSSDQRYMDGRLRFDTINEVDSYFCWGKHQKELVSKVVEEYSANTKVVNTGHPRIDLLRSPISLYENPQKTEKSTILINTKHAEYNHNKGENGWIEIMKIHNMINSQEEMDLRLDQVKYKKALFSEYKTLIEELSSEFSNSNIIVRPHPSENGNVWKIFAEDFPNVVVDRSKSVGYWIKKSDVVIHTSCTTGIEAFFLGKLPITYKPIPEYRFGEALPDLVSFETDNVKEVVDVIHSVIDDKFNIDEHFDKNVAKLEPYISNISGPFSYQLIMDEIDKIPLIQYNISYFNHISLSMKIFVSHLSNIKNNLLNVETRSISLEEMNDVVDKFVPILKLRKRPKIKKLINNVYLIQNG
ncbi:hypothetical protein L1S32_02505 [Methanogenium sp. S4BF]|uniref:surface carbohydrate biosynthesis protein n=1 Tax=Methanogenium sp. S4BF TaxID=1789226 RepID=UPI0024180267|nr:surface carbohydrate biosynthesis protein [Methanogenium sp. S4BF]WFN35008.1 hypothetical protein L1S32_02505 [Methanogenium sp. S4BF]